MVSSIRMSFRMSEPNGDCMALTVASTRHWHSCWILISQHPRWRTFSSCFAYLRFTIEPYRQHFYDKLSGPLKKKTSTWKALLLTLVQSWWWFPYKSVVCKESRKAEAIHKALLVLPVKINADTKETRLLLLIRLWHLKRKAYLA
jgi:hypothetical protein